jgi:hypothetical protein
MCAEMDVHQPYSNGFAGRAGQIRPQLSTTIFPIQVYCSIHIHKIMQAAGNAKRHILRQGMLRTNAVPG